MPRRILTVLGTRPEAIKLFPLLHALAADPRCDSRLCVTGQHGAMVDTVLAQAGIVPDRDCGPVPPGLTLDALTALMLTRIGAVLDADRPDWVVVQGDTATALAGALAGHSRQIPVAHVEAGLRSGDPAQPWPEEGNRKAISALATLHCAPTRRAADALLAEAVAPGAVHVTGNTVIDALRWTTERLAREPPLAGRMAALEERFAGRRIVGVTAHRRENWGAGLEGIATAVEALAARGDLGLIVPLHPNPAVRGPLQRRLAGLQSVALVEPLDYPDFTRLLSVATLMLTDSGGVQEEAPALGTPALVLRDTTERPEGIAAGTARLVGTDPVRIVAEAARLLDDPAAHRAMARAHNPYGDGQAAIRIAALLLRPAI